MSTRMWYVLIFVIQESCLTIAEHRRSHPHASQRQPRPKQPQYPLLHAPDPEQPICIPTSLRPDHRSLPDEHWRLQRSYTNIRTSGCAIRHRKRSKLRSTTVRILHPRWKCLPPSTRHQLVSIRCRSTHVRQLAVIHGPRAHHPAKPAAVRHKPESEPVQCRCHRMIDESTEI